MSPEFNLGLLHLLGDVAEKIYDLKFREYVYRQTKKKGIFNTRISRLANPEEGSAVKSWRKREGDKAHLPVDLWKKKDPVDGSD